MRYLVATDGSSVSDTAIRAAAVEAIAWDAVLEIVHVVTPQTELVEGNIVLTGDEEALDLGRQTLERAESVATAAAADRDTDIEITTELLTGRPAEAITGYADQPDATGIYVGHRGLSDRHEQVVGSVAKSIVDKATVPVTIVK